MIGKGIQISTGFDLNSQSPLDNRTVFETIEERDSLPSINLYEGLECFVKSTKENYQYINGEWVKNDGWNDVKIINDATNQRTEMSFYSCGKLQKTIYLNGVTIDDGEGDDSTIQLLLKEIELLKERILHLEKLHDDGVQIESLVLTTREGDVIITKDGDKIILK